MLRFGMSRAVQLLSVFSCRSSKCGYTGWPGEGLLLLLLCWVGGWGGGGGTRDQDWVVDLLKQTWTTGEQQAHIHIHHKTSTILYIDIWTSSPGRRVKEAALRRDQDRRAMAKWGGMRIWDMRAWGTPVTFLGWGLSCRRWRGSPAWWWRRANRKWTSEKKERKQTREDFSLHVSVTNFKLLLLLLYFHPNDDHNLKGSHWLH